MSLPKRDGIHDRYYLIHKPDTSPEVLAQADLCIQDVLNGTARENHSAYPTVVRNHNGTPFLPNQLLERYLSKLPLKGFPYEEAVTFCDALRRLVGWQEIRYTLEKYIEKQVQERYFEAGEKEDDFTPYPPCTVWPELRPEDVDEGLLRFACYVAVCHSRCSTVSDFKAEILHDTAPTARLNVVLCEIAEGNFRQAMLLAEKELENEPYLQIIRSKTGP